MSKRYSDWKLIDHFVGDFWSFGPDPFGNGIVGYGLNGIIMDPETAKEIFEGLQEFFDFHGGDRVQQIAEIQAECIRGQSSGIPSPLRWLYPKEFKRLSEQCPEDEQENQPSPDYSGFVYVVLATENLCKIGRTKDFESRLDQLEYTCPYKLEPIVVIETENMYDLEESLHKRFEGRRTKGEWFKLTDEDIGYLKGFK